MRYQLLFVPVAAVASASVMAEEYLTVEQAQALIFPGEKLAESHFVLADEQIEALVRMTGPLARRQVRVWKSASGGWFFLDHVIVKGDRIVYAVGLNADGSVKGIEILACLALYDGIRRSTWRTEFLGTSHQSAAKLDHIKAVSGSTLSCNNITTGIKRMLAIHAMFLAKQSSG
jgi:hypothetical protein